MALYDRAGRPAQFSRTNGRFDSSYDNDSPPLGNLLKSFGQDAATLVKQEIALAKLELQESVRTYAANGAKLGIAAGVGLLGALALAAFVIIGLGDLINNYWLSALIVAVALLGIAGLLASRALAQIKGTSLAPRETAATLQEDTRWAKTEAQAFKQQLKA